MVGCKTAKKTAITAFGKLLETTFEELQNRAKRLMLYCLEPHNGEEIPDRSPSCESVHSKQRANSQVYPVAGEFLKSCGHRRLIKASTVLPPSVRREVDR